MVEHRDAARTMAREWTVVGGLLLADRHGAAVDLVDTSVSGESAAEGILPERILLVANRRRGGALEWTPPGGVVDPGEAPIDALTREVIEETGLEVDGWTGPCYRVRVDFPDREMTLDVEVYRAVSWSGTIAIDDPDGIVEDARFVGTDEVQDLVTTAPPWVREPLGAWLAGPDRDGCTTHGFIARGRRPDDLVVERLAERSFDPPGT